MPGYRYLTYELIDDGTIARIKLNRPAARNAQNRGMLVELGDAMLAAEADDQVRVVILGGAGPLFSAGHDLGSADAVAERTAGPDLHATYSQYGATRAGAEKRTLQEWHFYFENTRRWRNLRKITIAEVQGAVYAAGLMLMWACDLIVAAEDVIFADVVGTRLGMCGVEYFAHPWELGPRRAKELLLTGDSIDAEEAHRLGMVSKIFPAAELDEQTVEYARRIAALPTVTALLIKESVNQTVDNMGFYNALNACFTLHELNHSHWAEIHPDKTPRGLPEDGTPDWRTAPPVRPSRRDLAVDAGAEPRRHDGAEQGAGQSLPLAGIRVVELGIAMAGPLTARYLGYFGADVIRIESRRRPDSLRVSRPPWLPDGLSPDVAQDTWPLLNLSSADKRGIVLEIDRADGYRAFTQIVAAADVFVTNLSADVIPRLRVSYDDIRALRPDVIYLATTAFGHDGPYRKFRTWGMNLCAISGLDAMVGWPDRDPTGIGMSFPDYPSALLAVTAIVAALQRRRRTGAGARLELPQFQMSLNCIGPAVVDAALGRDAHPARGNRAANGSVQGVYPAAGEDRWVAITVDDEGAWRGLCSVDGLEDLGADPRLATASGRAAKLDDIDERLAAWTRCRSDWQAAAELQEAGVAAVPVFDSWDVLGDQHLASRSYFQLAPSARFGADLVTRPAAAPAGLTQPARSGPPAMGEHTREVLRDLAGLPPEAIEQLLADGTAYQLPHPVTLLERPYLAWIGTLLRLPWPGRREAG